MANPLTQEKKDQIFEEMKVYIKINIEGSHHNFSQQLEKKMQSYLDIKNLEKMEWMDAIVIEKVFAQMLGENMVKHFVEDNTHTDRTFKTHMYGEHLPDNAIWSPTLKKFGEMGSLLRPRIFDQALNYFFEKTSDVFLAWHEEYEKKQAELQDITQSYHRRLEIEQDIKKSPLKESVMISIINNIHSGLTSEAKEDHSRVLKGKFEMIYLKPFVFDDEKKGLLGKSFNKNWILKQIQKLTATQYDSHNQSVNDRKKPD